MRQRVAMFVLVLAALSLVTYVAVPASSTVAPAIPSPTGATLVPLEPVRLLDTRSAGLGEAGRLPAGGSIDVPITGHLGVPRTGVVAVVLNVTATDSGGAGFVTVHPAGTALPVASTLNVTGAGQTRANLTIVPPGAGGAITVFSQSAAHLVLDVMGYFAESPGPSSAGRFVASAPTRLHDSRLGGAPARLAGSTLTIPVTGTAAVPSSGVAAVVLTVTVTDTDGPGFVTVWPSDIPRPLASAVNVNGSGETAANTVIVPVGPDGRVQVFSQPSAHLVIDVKGWFTDATAEPSTDGQFVALPPARLYDTRIPPSPEGIVPAASTLTVDLRGRAGLPAGGVGALVMNLTGTEPAGPGHVTVWATGRPMPSTSDLNLAAADTRANLIVAIPSSDLRLDHLASGGTHLVADVNGYFLADTDNGSGPTTTVPPTSSSSPTTTTPPVVSTTTTTTTTTTPPATTTTTTTTAPPAPQRIMPLGDSITAGYQVGDSSDYGYRVPLWQTMDTAGCTDDLVGTQSSGPGLAGFDTDHQGHPGATTAQILANVASWATTTDPDIVILHLGTNDAAMGTVTTAQARDNVQAIIAALRGVNPDVVVLVAQIIPTAVPSMNSWISTYNTLLQSMAASLSSTTSPVVTVDVNSGYSSGWLRGDGIHTTSAGRSFMAGRFATALDPYVVCDL